MEMPRKILEIGAGDGGPHLISDLGRLQYHVVDVDGEALERLKQRYPWVNVRTESAEKLSYPNRFFDTVEIRFPFNRLLAPGLQRGARDVFGLGKILDKYCPSTGEPQWYPEFARVLKSEGCMTIWGDEFVDETMIGKLSEAYFRFKEMRYLSCDEIERLGTGISRAIYRELAPGEISTNAVKEITLVKK